MKKPLRFPLVAMSSVALLMAGCAAEPSVEESPVEEQVEEVVAEPEVNRHPLTGFELPEGSVEGPSVAVKIDNTSSGRPQVGIAAADLVFEELVEGGVTRYLAVFHSAIPTEVGPVRSGRPQDADLIQSLGGIFVFSGVGNANVREIIRGTGLQLVEHDTSKGEPFEDNFFRSTRKPAPWNLHIEASAVAELYQDLTSPAEQFEFRTEPSESSAVLSGVGADSVRVTFSKRVQSIWEWDESSGTYLKFLENGEPDSDADGTQISATNLLVFTPNYFDVEGLPSAAISGIRETAYYFGGGNVISGLFDASIPGNPIGLSDLEGQNLFLTPGKTFILLPPGAGSTAGGVTVGSLTYQFQDVSTRLDF